MLKPGLCSVTLRDQSPEQVIELSALSGLKGIEWGADVHVPPSGVARARQIGQLTREAGLEVAGYGSYYLAHDKPGAESSPFAPVLEAAIALGAPVIRIWAGSLVMEKSDAYFEEVVQRIRAASESAAAHGIKLGCEFHRNTFTETVEGTLKLMEAVGHDNFHTFWQPPHGSSLDQRLGEIDALKERLLWVHVFHWKGADKPPFPRMALSAGADLWKPCLDAVACLPGERFALLEFARDDSVEQFQQDAEALLSLINS